MIKTNVSCYGCGVCVAECKFSAISMILSPDGFFIPAIDEKKCTNCGQCDKVCSFLYDAILVQNDKISELAYSGITKDDETLLNASSGGIAFELAKTCLKKGYSVIGCKYDYAKQIAAHKIATGEEELKQTIGSKYIQSWTNDALKNIDLSNKYAVFGSPCQIDSLRRFARKNNCEQNWLFVDFFCHGVPSYNLWNKYIDFHKPQDTKIASVKFRDKKNGWGVQTMTMTMTMTMTNGKSRSCAVDKNDFFLNMFLGNYVLNEPCYSCKFHGLKSSADIRVGDFWSKKYKSNTTGVSSLLVFTKNGEDLLKNIEKNCVIAEETIKTTLEEQISKNLPIPKNRKKIITELKTQKSLPLIYFRYCFKSWGKNCLPKFIKNYIRSIIRKRRDAK